MSQESNLSNYVAKNRELSIQSFAKTTRIAILSSFTINGIEDVFRVKCSEININCITYSAPYNQYNQEILNPKSDLYQFKPSITFLILDTRSMLGNLYYFPYSVSAIERRNFVQKKIDETASMITAFIKNSDSKLIITNFNIPTYSPYGILENKTDYGFHEMVKNMNEKLLDVAKNLDSVYIYDFDRFTNYHGAEHVFDFRQYYYGDLKIALKYFPYFVNDLMGYVKAITGTSKKCIVLDLDNTLWGGIVGEDGFDGIKLGSTSPGNAYVEFQRYLLSLWQKGILLAINSKNNYDDAIQTIRNHPNMVLREDNFANVHVNWENKVDNMKEIAQELNLGLDSFVYFDDDPVNRASMIKHLPEVLTVDLPKDPSQFVSILAQMNDFNILSMTEEDLMRGQMYLQHKKRIELEKTATNLDDFLKDLDIKIKIKKADKFTIPRISQLTLKTNQFNLTTKRYQEEDIRNFSQNDSMIVGCAQVEDKFGDNGITGVFIIKKENSSEWEIDTFLLSCRVMGREVEAGILGYLLQKAKNENVKKVKGKYVPTKKNKPCESFLSNNGFKQDGQNYVFQLEDQIKIPQHLVVSEE